MIDSSMAAVRSAGRSCLSSSIALDRNHHP